MPQLQHGICLVEHEQGAVREARRRRVLARCALAGGWAALALAAVDAQKVEQPAGGGNNQLAPRLQLRRLLAVRGMRLQPGLPMVAAWTTRGCSLDDMWLQVAAPPPAPTWACRRRLRQPGTRAAHRTWPLGL